MILFALKESLHVIHGLDLTQTMSSPVLSLLFKLPKLKTTERKILLLLPVLNFLREWTDTQVLACPAVFTWNPLR